MKEIPEDLKNKIASSFPNDESIREALNSSNNNALAVILARKAISIEKMDIYGKLRHLDHHLFVPANLSRFLDGDTPANELKEVIREMQEQLSESGLHELISALKEAKVADISLGELNTYID